MNEQFITQLHEEAVRNGYTGDVNSFINLLKTNPDAKAKALSLVESKGYTGGESGFDTLVGLEVKNKPKVNLQNKPINTSTKGLPSTTINEGNLKGTWYKDSQGWFQPSSVAIGGKNYINSKRNPNVLEQLESSLAINETMPSLFNSLTGVPKFDLNGNIIDEESQQTTAEEITQFIKTTEEAAIVDDDIGYIQEKRNILDTSEEEKNIKKRNIDEVKDVYGYWEKQEDGSFFYIPGLDEEKQKIEDSLKLKLMQERAPRSDRTGIVLVEEEDSEAVKKRERFFKVNQGQIYEGLKQKSIQDYAAKNFMTVDEVTEQFSNLNIPLYTIDDMKNNKEIYDFVINNYVLKEAKSDTKEYKKEVLGKELEKSFDTDQEKDKNLIKRWVTGTDEAKDLNILLSKEIEEKRKLIDDLSPTVDKFYNEFQEIQKQVNADHEWLSKNNPDDFIKKLESRTYATDKDRVEAIAEWEAFKKEYNLRLNRLKSDVASQEELNVYLTRGVETLNALSDGLEDDYLIKNYAKRNYSFGYNISNHALSSIVSFTAGLDELTRRFNPFKLINTEKMDPSMKGFFDGLSNNGILDVVDIVNPIDNITGLGTREAMDKFVDYTTDRRALYDFMPDHNVAKTMLMMADMTPQILLGLTGIGNIALLSTISASAVGNSFVRFEEDGLEGMNLYSTALWHGSWEGLSEAITGRFGGRALTRFATPSANIGFKKGMKNLLGVGSYTGYEAGLEGLSEGTNAFAGNIWDKFVLGKDVSLWNGVSASFLDGATVSVGFKTPLITKSIVKPIIPPDVDAQLAGISDQIMELSNTLEKPNLDPSAVESIQLQISDLVNKSNKIYDNAITNVASIEKTDKERLINIEVESYNTKKSARDVTENNELTVDEKQNALEESQKAFDELQKEKQNILDKYKKIPQETKNRRYNAQKKYLQELTKLAKKQGVDIHVDEVNTEQFENIISKDVFNVDSKNSIDDISFSQNAFIEMYKKVLKDPDSTTQEKQEATEQLKTLEEYTEKTTRAIEIVNKESRNYGAFAPRINENGDVVGYNIILNKQRIFEDGKFSTAAHEMVHALFYNTLKSDPIVRDKVGTEVINILNSDGVKFKPGKRDLFRKRISAYEADIQGEEVLAIASEMLADGDISFNDSILTKLKNTFRRFTQGVFGKNYEIKFDNQKDVENFLRDYNTSIKRNKPNAALAKMMAKGAKGKLVEKPLDQRTDEINFSKAVDANIKSDPDLMAEIDAAVKDQFGNPLHESHAAFKLSPEYYKAFTNITETRLLDGLIQQGMMDKGLPPEALREFVRKTKENISYRFLKNFNLDKNDSLFGWLTGVSGGAGQSIIYRAKGDVMNEYKKQDVDKTSLDKPVGEAGTLADIVRAEKDNRIKELEDMDLSPGRKKVAVEIINEVKVKDVLDFSKETKDAIAQAVINSNIDIVDLTYKDFKKLIASTEKVTRKDKSGNIIIDKKTNKPKLFNPTKTADASPTGALYNILEATSSEFGVDPLRILANQDLDGPMREAAQEYIYLKSINEGGSFNPILFDLLPEGETRSGQATGIANTKLGDLYIKSDRVKVSEGASKKLGQKESQTKKKSVTKEEFLGLFGINPDGSSLPGGTKFDGAIRQLILSISQLTSNQEVRLDSIVNGSASEAVRAKLADGKSQMVFSKATPEQNTVESAMPDIISEIASGSLELEAITNAIQKATGLKGKPLNKIAEKYFKLIGDFKDAKAFELKTKVEDITFEDRAELAEYIIDKYEFEQLEQSLNKLLELKRGEVSNRLKTIDGAEKQRDHIQDIIPDLFIEGLKKILNDPKSTQQEIDDANKLLKEQTKLKKQKLNTVVNIIDDIEKYGPERAGELIMLLKPAYAGAGKIADGSNIPDKPGGNLIENKDTQRSKEQRYQTTNGIKDYIAIANRGFDKPWIRENKGKYEVLKDGKYVKIKSTFLPETSIAAIKNLTEGKFNEYKKQAEDARLISEILLDAGWQKVKQGKWDNTDFAALTMSLGSQMDAPLRRSAYPEYIQEGIDKIIKEGKAKGIAIKNLVRYEHMLSKEDIVSKIVNSYIKNDKLDSGVWDGYVVQIISKQADDLQNYAGYKTKPAPKGFTRLFNLDTFRALYTHPNSKEIIENLAPLKSFDPDKKGTEAEIIGDTFVSLIKDVVGGNFNVVKTSQTLAKVQAGRLVFSKETPKAKGASILDFDDTLATTKSRVITVAPDGTRGYMNAEQYAKGYVELAEQGYSFDFSEFSKVIKGKVAPLFKKALKLQSKFGPENMFVLTARPVESAPAIYEFLKANGLNIPLKNITGLANSTSEAKALWIAENIVGKGYNDLYFADDALQNVQAVQNMLDQFDVKSKVQQARIQFSKDVDTIVDGILDEGKKDLDSDFNIILEETKGVAAEKEFSIAKARQRGKRKKKFQFFLPPSAEDFKGLIYPFLGKGKIGEKHHAFFKEKLFDPYSRGIRAINALKQTAANDLKLLRKNIQPINKILKNKIKGLEDYTTEQAIRVYNFDKADIEIPGLTKTDRNKLIKHVKSNPQLEAFADTFGALTDKAGGIVVDNSWLAGTLSSDLNDAVEGTRKNLLAEWIDNKEIIFSEKNLNKIEAVYGRDHREALEDVLWRMENNTNRRSGGSRIVNGFQDWINGSIGATMFFNARSAVLQTISTVNFINWSDNNMIKAAGAFANQKQYWKDFASLFQSDYLKQRRGGLQHDVNANEMVKAVQDSKNPARAAIGYLLQKGFLPTQIADSFAIASGGATFYRNRIKAYVKDGLTQKEAETKAFEDFMEIAEETQQSARPDKISQQHASPLGKLILAFQNTPMQYNRLIKRAMQDLVNGRGDAKTHLSKIVYYGAIQNAIFYGLQQALFALLFGDDDEEDEKKNKKKEDSYARVVNGMLDSLLRGSGIAGAVVSTVKNTILRFMDEEKKAEDGKFYTEPDHAYTLIEALNLSPPIGIKARKMYSATQSWEFNRDVIKHMPKTSIDNPMFDALFNAVEATTNVPLARAHSKIRNIREALNSDNETFERVALFLGWSTWNFGIQNQNVMTAKQEIKEIKAEERKVKAEEKKLIKAQELEAENKIKEEEFKKQQAQEKKEGKKEITCAAVNKKGERCKSKPVDGVYCTVHQKVEQREDGKKTRCTKIKSDGERCKMQTNKKSGLCYYHD